MSTLRENTHIWRTVALILLLVAILGPWAYSPIQVPAELDCDGPRLRLQDDVCGMPLSLRFIASRAVVGAIPNVLSGHAALQSLIPFPFSFLLFFLPFFTMLPLLWRTESAAWRLFNAVAWGLVIVQGIVLLSRTPLRPHALPWGLLLYLVVALATLILELRAFLKGSRFWRAVALVLLIIAMSGPWTYDLIHVPAQFTCDGPNVRLQGEFCGLPFSLFSGINFTFIGPFTLFLILFILPVFTTLTLLRGGAHERQRTINIITWTVATAAAVVYLVFQLTRPYTPPWGLRLYVLVALAVIALELWSRMRSRKPLRA